MDSRHRAIRALLQSMSPKRATDYIKSFGLTEEEELVLIECDVKRRTYASQYSNGYTERVIKDRKKSAYSKISDEIEHEKRKGRG